MTDLIWHAKDSFGAINSMRYGSDGAAGLDLAAAANSQDEQGDLHWTILPGFSTVIDTGVQVAIPEGHFGRVVMRSGHGFKRDLICHVGTIDSDYRGPIKVKVFNVGNGIQIIQPGERFAQLIVMPFVRVTPVYTNDDLAEAAATARGEGGFGSTGA